jgi:hypothetical protein
LQTQRQEVTKNAGKLGETQRISRIPVAEKLPFPSPLNLRLPPQQASELETNVIQITELNNFAKDQTAASYRVLLDCILDKPFECQ